MGHKLNPLYRADLERRQGNPCCYCGKRVARLHATCVRKHQFLTEAEAAGFPWISFDELAYLKGCKKDGKMPFWDWRKRLVDLGLIAIEESKSSYSDFVIRDAVLTEVGQKYLNFKVGAK